ncbi:MAG TPA: VCBS repeat-containing protein [Candidatus Nanoarchaeia archaeon]|nr:VCBS repeat-containing protein [Candidatus Nanoarchaeia archaeon]
MAHLLEDASQPSHIHLDPHLGHSLFGIACLIEGEDCDDSVLEEYTGDNFNTLRTTENWTGSNFAGQQYNYENLPNLSSFNWKEVEPNVPLDKKNIELFRLFWYTAQKTQYFASDDRDGNAVYVNISGATKNFPVSLWANENLRIINESEHLAQDDVTNSGPNVSAEADAMLPHSMKAVAGLYRLFDDAVKIDWPTDHHDYRRTGFTLLKGDMNRKEDVDKIDVALRGNLTQDIVMRPSITDLDNNGYQDVVTAIHDLSDVKSTEFIAVEKNKKYGFIPQNEQKWRANLSGGSTLLPVTLGNIDSDSRKEVIIALRNGTIRVLDISADGKAATEKWAYSLPEKNSTFAGSASVELGGGSAVADIDLDGVNEIILTDKAISIGAYDWPGEVYVIDGSGGSYKKKFNYTFGNGGAFASVSVANIDDDDNPEIIVPGYYGINVFDYNSSAPNNLTLKWSNNDGFIKGSAVIYDVDRDNEYELIYVTTNATCSSFKKCTNKLFIRDAKTGNNESNSPINLDPYRAEVTPAVANLDSDSQAEIVISVRNTKTSELGKIIAYDSSTLQQSWSYDDNGNLKTSFVAPDIADMDNDGKYNILFAENNGTDVYILNEDGTELFRYNFTAFVDSALAIADTDYDGVAEIALKRSGSPIGLLSVATSFNQQPTINAISNITGIAGNLLQINATGEISGTDPNQNDTLTFFYSSPFNESGQWQTTVNDTGNYSILVEVSDGNLSASTFVDVILFNETTVLQNNFTDNSNQKILNFSSAGNITIQIRIPKEAAILYSKIKMKGEAP